jgi:hypothetical protein
MMFIIEYMAAYVIYSYLIAISFKGNGLCRGVYQQKLFTRRFHKDVKIKDPSKINWWKPVGFSIQELTRHDNCITIKQIYSLMNVAYCRWFWNTQQQSSQTTSI